MSSDGHLTLPMTLGTAWSAPSPDRLGTPLRPSGILSVTTRPAHAHERPLPTRPSSLPLFSARFWRAANARPAIREAGVNSLFQQRNYPPLDSPNQ